MVVNEDWLVRQAVASAKWLAEVPIETLSPVGRSLRAVSSDWVNLAGVTTFESVQGKAPTHPDSPGDGSRQLPLMNSLSSD